MFDLKGRIALVTGGSRGLGRAIVLDLSTDCEWVGFTYASNGAAAEEVVALARSRGGRVSAYQADVCDEARMAEVAAAIAAQAGSSVDLLVNNAGVNRFSPILTADLKAWNEALAINLTGPLVCARSVVKEMMLKGCGSIINMSSITGLRGRAGEASYSATKAGLIGLTKAMAWEFAPYGIRVNAIAPGWIDTGMVEKMSEKARDSALKLIKSKRFGKPEEVVAAVRYLASPAGACILAQTLVLDGGIQ